jgi:DNA helicase HerA-like ATPase
MFFVAMLLSRLIAWMRRQPGTPSLRALLYMDEVFGFVPPVANPPTKRLLLTLLKQARAHGLGVVLATQNPVDLDYKGLANAGTWFIGRMPTERDKARVLEGLKSADSGERLTNPELAAVIASLGKRRFLLHNVHEAEPGQRTQLGGDRVSAEVDRGGSARVPRSQAWCGRAPRVHVGSRDR